MKKLLIHGLLLLLIACKSSFSSISDFEVYNIEINLNNKIYPLEVNKHLDSLEYIFLETTENNFFTSIDDLIIKNNLLYIYDKHMAAILIFGMDGKYHFKVNNIGKGPHEYSQLLDYTIDKDYIYILAPSEVVIYKALTGEFVKKHKIDFSEFMPIHIEVDEIYIYFKNADIYKSQNIQATIVIYDKDFNFVNAHTDPYFFKDRSYVSEKILIPTRDGIFYHEALNDTIYKIEENYLLPIYYLNVGQKQVTYEKYEKYPINPERPVSRIVPTNMIHPIDNILIGKDIMLFKCYEIKDETYYSNIYLCIFSLQNQQIKVLNTEILKDDFKYGTYLSYIFTVDNEDYVYVHGVPAMLDGLKETGVVLDKKVRDLHENENPFIVRYKFKSSFIENN